MAPTRPTARRKPRRPRDIDIVSFFADGSFIVGRGFSLADLQPHDARILHKKLGEFCNWLDAQSPKPVRKAKR